MTSTSIEQECSNASDGTGTAGIYEIHAKFW